jgi:hypothetical protein
MMAHIPERCWIVAAGDCDRNYANLCLRHGVIVAGPGDLGPLDQPENVKNYRDHCSSRLATTLERFRDIGPGDLVILRLGQSEIHGVGYVCQRPNVVLEVSYDYSNAFEDVDGWDLQHFHAVRWIWAKPEDVPKSFINALNRGDTTQLFYRSEKNATVWKWIEEELDDSSEAAPGDPKSLKAGKEINIRDITTKLYDYGLGAGSISEIDEQILDLCRLAEWYRKYGVEPSETETVSHLVTPLLLSLGWTPQRIALEFAISGKGRADVALFPNGNRKEYEPVAIVEAKKLNQSCLSASDQIRRYAEDLNDVRRLIVTDGIRYGIFIRHGEEPFSEHPSAYMNLTRLRDCYPIWGPNCGGADEVMLTLSAAWNHRFKAPKAALKDAAAGQEAA